MRVYAKQMREQYETAQKAGTLNPQWAATVQGIFATYGEQLRKLGVAELPVDNRPPEQREGQGDAAGGALAVTVTSPCSPSDSAAQSESK